MPNPETEEVPNLNRDWVLGHSLFMHLASRLELNPRPLHRGGLPGPPEWSNVVLAVRRKQCVAMAGNMEVELKKCGAHKFVVQCIASHREVIEKREHRF